jgi:hypothetical protein
MQKGERLERTGKGETQRKPTMDCRAIGPNRREDGKNGRRLGSG